jgi:hypothetical protein
LAGLQVPEQGLLIETIARDQLDTALEDEPGRYGAVPDLEQPLTRLKAAWLGVRKTAHDLQLCFPELWEALRATVGDGHHGLDLLLRSHLRRSE